MNRFLLTLMVTLLSAQFFYGCAETVVDENDPASMMKDAEEDIKSDHYQIAIDKLRKIKNKFPYSKYSAEAQLRIGDVNFLQESFTEAALAYETFRDLHPRHEKVSYAIFRMGLSYFKDIPDLPRDLAPAQRAFDSFQEYLKRFPQGAESAEAKSYAEKSRDLLAEKELYVARFYLREKSIKAAHGRYLRITELYPETRFAKEAQEKLSWIKEKFGDELKDRQ
jgi:outer membrane protein assembly factor BamD